MQLDLRFLKIKTEEAIEDMERMRDVELADLFAAVFGAWSFIISLVFVLYTGDASGIVTGILPSLVITAASGINVYRVRSGQHGWEALNQISLIAGLWMMLSSGLMQGPAVMQYSNTFSGMWIGLTATYAAFLRQNDPHRETVIQIRGLAF